MDPTIGKLKLYNVHANLTAGSKEIDEIELEELSETDDQNALSLLANLPGKQGIYIIKDVHKIELFGSLSSNIVSYVKLEFELCRKEPNYECASKSEIDTFLADKRLVIWGHE